LSDTEPLSTDQAADKTTVIWMLEFRHGQNIFLFYTVFSPAVGPTQSHIQWALGGVIPGVKTTEA